jgi:hypothetical protein
MSSKGRSDIVHAEGCGSAVTVTSRVSISKPSISTLSVQTPSVASGSLKTPSSSVAVTSFLSPEDAVTVAPGTGRPPYVTWPECSPPASRTRALTHTAIASNAKRETRIYSSSACSTMQLEIVTSGGCWIGHRMVNLGWYRAEVDASKP